ENNVKNEGKNIENKEILPKKETENKENNVKNEGKNIENKEILPKKEAENKENNVKNEGNINSIFLDKPQKIKENNQNLLGNTQKKEQKVSIISTEIESDNLYFEIGTQNLTQESIEILENSIEILNNYPNLQAFLVGHTCNIGNTQKNIQLSIQRAEKIKDLLIKKGVSTHRIQIKGMGDKYPIEKNDTEQGRRANRRVEILVE
ncbi:MAG: OmpA family protein, partial [Bacteroidetes bacterium]